MGNRQPVFSSSLISTTAFAILLLPILLSAQSLPGFARAADAVIRHPDMAPANIGLCVVDVQSGQQLYGYQERKSMITASTMKALTTATAISILGPNFRFETSLAVDGNIRNGVIEGDLLIVGSGDPTLGSDRLRTSDALGELMYNWAQILKQQGIIKITGSVVGDDSFFPTQITPGNWGWEDMGNYYGAGASALNIAENTYRLDFSSPSRTGALTTILRTDPEMPIYFVNEVTAGPSGSGDNAYIFGASYTQIRYVRGTIPPGRSLFSIKGSIPDPALFCASELTASLKSCGMSVGELPTTARLRALAGKPAPRRGQVLHTHYSTSLADIAQACNFNSINLYAEALAKRVAVETARPGLSTEGAYAMRGYWNGKGVNTEGMSPKDGSGLSPNNTVTARQYCDILRLMMRDRHADAFWESLPVAGQSGAMKSKLRGTVAEGKVRAKSGYISGVRGYVGYAELPDGRVVAFAFIANHYEGSTGAMGRRLEGLMEALAAGR